MSAIQPLAPKELAERLARGDDLVLLDVREPAELAVASIARPGVVAIPLGHLGRRHGELDPARPIVCICHHGMRSSHAAALLARAGFGSLFNLSGGIDRWSREVDSSVPRY
ncbi:MAG: rhodanese [Planctomycetes bacterium]|nr:rhodanese [Planctomycetota bacterium]